MRNGLVTIHNGMVTSAPDNVVVFDWDDWDEADVYMKLGMLRNLYNIEWPDNVFSAVHERLDEVAAIVVTAIQEA